MNFYTKSKDCYNKLTKMFPNETVTYGECSKKLETGDTIYVIETALDYDDFTEYCKDPDSANKRVKYQRYREEMRKYCEEKHIEPAVLWKDFVRSFPLIQGPDKEQVLLLTYVNWPFYVCGYSINL